MGKTKIATIDDSISGSDIKDKKPKEKIGRDQNQDRDGRFGSINLIKNADDISESVQIKKVNPSPEELEAEKKKVNPNLEVMEKERRAKKAQKDEVSGSSEIETIPIATLAKTGKQPKQGRPKQRSKKYQEKYELVERNRFYPIDEAAELAKQLSYSKFDGTLEVHINSNTKGLRGLVSLPYMSGKKLRILAFGSGAKESGADLVGDDEKLAEIEKGKIGFDILVTTPEWMPKLAKAAKVLGPKGLMPNPKNESLRASSSNGTITTDLKKTVAELQGGKTEYKTEAKIGIIHLGVGKLSQPAEELSQNLKVLLSTIGKSRIKKATISPTMGPGIRLDLNST